MEIRINGTGELKELRAIGTNGIEWTGDLLGNHDATTYNHETEEHEMSSDDFGWWEEYISDNEKDAAEVVQLAEEFGINEGEIWERINENLTCDLGDEHQVKQNVLAEIRAGHKTGYNKDDFKEMIEDWKADHSPEMDNLVIDEITLESEQWTATACDEKTAYTLTDDGTGNIVINYLGTR